MARAILGPIPYLDVFVDRTAEVQCEFDDSIPDLETTALKYLKSREQLRRFGLKCLPWHLANKLRLDHEKYGMCKLTAYGYQKNRRYKNFWCSVGHFQKKVTYEPKPVVYNLRTRKVRKSKGVRTKTINDVVLKLMPRVKSRSPMMDPVFESETGGSLVNPVHNKLLRAVKANKIQAIYGQFDKSRLCLIKTLTGRDKFKYSKYFKGTKIYLYAYPCTLIVIGDVKYLYQIFKKYKSFEILQPSFM